MDVMIFGATGMVGQGVLRECLLDPDVNRVLAVGRTVTGVRHSRLREIIADDLFDLTPIAPELTGFDACIFCLGLSAAGMTEAAYSRLTHDLTLGVAATLARLNPSMTFIYVSGAGTDSTERGGVMWARVKGRTENALQRLPFKRVYLFRPGIIQPLHGARSKTRAYRFFYAISAPILPLLRRLLPHSITTTEQLGRKMLDVAKRGASQPILEMKDITG
ncbi:MAG: epimerase [Acidobacteriota bacterium]